MITIEPHSFTATDARRTVENLDALWGLLIDGRPGAEALLAPLRPQLTGDVDADLPRVWSALCAAGPALRAAGLLPARAEGRIDALHRSDGGVPKHATSTVEVDWTGVVGDRQAARQHHGRPWQALCVWSAEVVDAFAGAGHPIAAGNAGENVTVRGLDWSQVRPGVRLQLGSVVCDVSAYALPCFKNKRWFTGGDFNLMHHDRGPVSRVYATVVQPGRMSVGDAAVLEP
ncbi:MAG: MOSC domain-containing protein [Actinobacteria bacterium]|nr:MOSC domain-containing protein [Actinomycetota bacterium]